MFSLKVSRAAALVLACAFFSALAAGCQRAAAATGTAFSTSTPAAPTQAPTAPPTLTSTPQPATFWLPEWLPEGLNDGISIQGGMLPAADETSASARLEVLGTGETAANPQSVAWVYALAAPFPTTVDDVALDDLRKLWRGSPTAALPARRLVMDAPTREVFSAVWGKPGGQSVRVLDARSLLDTAWASQGTWAILPFEQLEPRWKVLRVDGQTPLDKEFQPAAYGLTATFVLSGDPAAAANVSLPPSNRRADRLTTVMLSGVTALVRGTASLMEGRGMTYPARDIGPWLREADILHINNEVPFAKDCPQPFDWTGLVFCSQTEYIELLENVGTDVVELTGDHFQDWGPEAMLYSLELYKQRGWKVYGGGANAAEARQPALFEHNGNRIAFIGCNAKEPGYAKADAENPGAIHCDFEQMTADVKKLRADGYLPIVTFQHLEYYQYEAHPILQQDFRRMAKAGAVIVSGSQAHQPQAFEFNSGALLHYGLGNLFFDQTNQGDPPRTAFIDRHVFYDGRYIGTELLTIYLVDYARSRPMTGEERLEMLTTVFQASEW